MYPRSAIAIRLYGSAYSFHLGWLLVFVAVSAVTLRVFRPEDAPNADLILWYAGGVVLIAGFIGSLLIHEAGHAYVANLIGVSPEQSRLYPFGAAGEGYSDPGAPGQDTLVALAGPLVSVALGGTLALAWWLLPDSVDLGKRDLGYLALGNLGLAGLNLLPAYPLDGGRVFRALVWYLHDDFATGARVAVAYSQVISFFFLASGMAILMVDSKASIWGLWIFAMSWGLNRSARGELTRVFFQVVGAKLTVGETVEGLNPRVEADQPLDQVVDVLLARQAAGPALVADDGRIVGVISLPLLRRVPRTFWKSSTAREAMRPIDEFPCVESDVTVRDLLSWLTAVESELLVVMREGEAIGVIDRRLAINRLFERARSRYRLTR